MRTACCSVMAVMLGKIINCLFIEHTLFIVCLSNPFPSQAVFYIYLFLDQRSKVEHVTYSRYVKPYGGIHEIFVIFYTIVQWLEHWPCSENVLFCTLFSGYSGSPASVTEEGL